MSAPANGNPQSAYGVRRTLTALIAAAALALILHAIAAAPVAAATTVKASVARGTLLISGTPSADRIAVNALIQVSE